MVVNDEVKGCSLAWPGQNPENRADFIGNEVYDEIEKGD
jgi:hypothetical protein